MPRRRRCPFLSFLQWFYDTKPCQPKLTQLQELVQIIIFSITVSSLELVNSGAMLPADSSVFETTAFPLHRVSVLLCSGVRDSNPSPHTLFFSQFPWLDSNQARKEKSGYITKLSAAQLCHWITAVFQHSPKAHRRICPILVAVEIGFLHSQSRTAMSTSSFSLNRKPSKCCFKCSFVNNQKAGMTVRKWSRGASDRFISRRTDKCINALGDYVEKIMILQWEWGMGYC